MSGNILEVDEETSADGGNREENPAEGGSETIDAEQTESKKVTRRAKAKLTSFVASDLSKITLEHEFEFRPLQPPNMCQWRGGIGKDSIYAEMVCSTMYSSSDYPLIDGFTNANSRPEEQQLKIEHLLEHTSGKMIDLVALREAIKTTDDHDHTLGRVNSKKFLDTICLSFEGTQSLREFSFNETPSGSFIDTLHESCLGQVDDSIEKSYTNNDENDHDDGYNHEELVDAAIEDLTDDQSHTNEVFKHALNELSQQDPSTMHSNLGNYQSQQSAHVSDWTQWEHRRHLVFS